MAHALTMWRSGLPLFTHLSMASLILWNRRVSFAAVREMFRSAEDDAADTAECLILVESVFVFRGKMVSSSLCEQKHSSDMKPNKDFMFSLADASSKRLKKRKMESVNPGWLRFRKYYVCFLFTFFLFL